MIAGRMRSRINVYKPTYVENAFGETERAAWEAAGTWHAERVSMTGRRSIEVAEQFSDYTARYNVRAGHKPKEGWRIEDEDAILYEIVAIEPNRHRGFLTLICNRVNE